MLNIMHDRGIRNALLIPLLAAGVVAGMLSMSPATVASDEAPVRAQATGPILEGRVVDDLGRPMKGATVVLHGGLATRWEVGRATTDERGVYRFEPLPGRAMVQHETDTGDKVWHAYVGVSIEHATHCSTDGCSWWDIEVPLEPGETFYKDFRLQEGGTIEGVIIDESTGDVLRHADLRLRLGRDDVSKFWVFTTTDEHGRFRATALYPGQYTIDVNEIDPFYPQVGVVNVEQGEISRVALRTQMQPSR